MTEMETLSFKEKLSNLRNEAAALDWTPEGNMTLGKNDTKYIKIGQMKGQLAPLFAKHRLEFKANMARPEPLGSPSAPSGWLVRLDISIIDVDSDDTEEYTFYGQGSGDKAIVIANSFALKTMLSTVFLIAEGADPIEEEERTSAPNWYTTPAKVIEKKAEIKDVAKKETELANKPKSPVAKPVEKPAEKPVEKPVEKPAEAPKADAMAEPIIGVKISKVKLDAIMNILEGNRARLDAGEITADELNNLVNDAKAITGEADAAKFVIKHRL